MSFKKQQVISLHNQELVACMVLQEEVTSSSLPFATAKPGKNAIYMMTSGGVIMDTLPTLIDAALTTNNETIIEQLKVITEGIAAPKAEAIHDSVLSSNNIIDPDNLTNYSPSQEEIDEIKSVYDAMMKQLEDMKAGSGAGNANGKLAKYFFKKHVLMQGEKGGGKTYMITKMIAKMNSDIKSIDIRGNEGLEAWMFLGNYIKTESGSLVWVDGPLAEAFRSAAKGVKTILFIDEMLRIPKRELNVLVGSLSPDYNGNFSLDIDRASSIEVDEHGEGIGVREKIVVPKNMLWCVGTTNAGAGYSVDTIDEALGDRFRVLIKKTGEKEMNSILTSVAKDYGHDKKEVTKLMKFYKSFNTLKESGELNKLINLRHLAEILEFSDDQNTMADAAEDLIPTWCSQDQHGYPNETQASIIEGLIEKELS